jgi:hypothetical protein
MKKTLSFGLILIPCLTLAVVFGQVVMSAAAPLKIMPLGDSITYGVSYDGGYRVELFKDFGSDPNKVVFVGSQTNGSTYLPTSPVNETHHEGHSGWTIKNSPELGRSGLYESTAGWLNTYNPDLILLMIGTNDVNKNYQVSTAPDRLDQLISLIFQTKPKVNLIVGNLTPIDDAVNQYASDGQSNPRVNAFNLTVPGIVQHHHDDLGQNVYFCDIHSRLALNDLYDGLHPNAGGYNKMGDAWYAAIQAIPEPGTLYLLIAGGASLAVYAWLRRKNNNIP